MQMRRSWFIKGIACLLCLSICVLHPGMVRANDEYKHILPKENSNVVNICEENYNAKVITEFTNDFMAKYLVEENGIEYTLLYDLVNKKVTVNDKTYTLQSFQSAAEEQALTISNEVKAGKVATVVASTTNIIDILSNYKTVDTVDMGENILLSKTDNISTSSIPPKTGYLKERYVGEYKKSGVLYGLTAAALTIIAAFAFKGNVKITEQFVRSTLKSAVSAGLIASITETIHGNQYYKKYQSMHSTKPATRERRLPFASIQGHRFYGKSYTWYFWYSRPY